MNSIVLELQHDATSQTIPITDLLRKALLVARKLGILEFEVWIRRELNGYNLDDELPPYRIIQGQPRAKTFAGLKPIGSEDEEVNRLLSKGYVRQSAGEILELVSDEKAQHLTISLPARLSQILTETHGIDVYAMLFCSKASFAAILDAVRNTILEWSLKLEEEGIIGEGMTFSAEEKQKATQTGGPVSYISIGHMVNSQILQGSEGSTQTQTISSASAQALMDFLSDLKQHLAEHQNALDASTYKEAEADIATIESQLSSPRPKRAIINQSLSSLRNILEGAGGSLIASGIMEQFPILLAMMSAT